MDPMSLKWCEPSAEFANDEEKSAVHIFNHDLTDAGKAARAARFAEGRVAWYAKAKDCAKQEVWFDDRGQQVPGEVRAKLRETLGPKVAGIVFMGEDAGDGGGEGA